MMKRFWALLVITVAMGFTRGVAQSPDDRLILIVVTGIAGAPEYEEVFSAWSRQWLNAGERAGARVYSIGLGEESGEKSDRERLKALIEEAQSLDDGELWLVLNGHGTYDGNVAKFNLSGPDVAATDLAEWLREVSLPVAVVSGFSGSAPFINQLSAPNRVILSATKSGYELNYSRFGGFVAEAVGGLAADLDKDGQVSLLEAFLKGARDAEEFYALEGRLASEHALIDDTGDKRGTGSDWYRGVRVIKKPEKGTHPDGRRAHQFHLIRSEFEQQMPTELRERRNDLELRVLALRDRKDSFANEATYYAELEALFLKLADLYGEVEARLAGTESP